MKRLALEAKLINYCNICGKKYSFKFHHKNKYDVSRFWTRYECKNCPMSFHILRGYEFTYTIFDKNLVDIVYIRYFFKNKILSFYAIDYNNLEVNFFDPILELKTSFKDTFKHIKKYYDNLIFT